MQNKKIILGISIFFLLALSIFALSSSLNKPAEIQDSINYHSSVCKGILRSNGNYEDLGCQPNTLTTAGQNLIKFLVGSGTSSGAVDYIALCNATAGCTSASASSTTLESEYDAGGLSRSQGTYNSNGDGNWTITKTFTATADNLITNKTGIFNASSTGTLFAENTFTLATLQTNDQITINWTISVS